MTFDEHGFALSALLDVLPVGDLAKKALVSAMTAPDRHYHDVGHLTTLWRRHCLHAPSSDFELGVHTRRLACAIAYHDFIYVAGRTDNEERSAEVWLDVTRDAGLSDGDRLWVAGTIRATSDHLSYPPRETRSVLDLEPHERARLWMLDLDLTPIGEAPADFDRNTSLLRREVPDLSDDAYDTARMSFLRRLDRAPVIFRSKVLHAIYERPARANIARQLAPAL